MHLYYMSVLSLEPIVISDNEGPEPSCREGSGSGEETEHEPVPLHIAKRARGVSFWLVDSHTCSTFYILAVHSPDRTEGNVGLELSASVSSLCLGEASSSTAPPNLALGAWATLRKASAPFFVDGTEGDTSFEF